ncbi:MULTISPECIES: hypothetical protein [Ensifer]|jgi:hypothetical protein|uniref:hypothetical protein n=1 Tax=Ensifer TaxID=106591 RepID=UPI00070CD301|nr:MULTISPECIES: hypothetical protein [Ensifer]KQW54845.1 hypothetical protein ASD03_20005 [Ensifer sp. Root127]KQW61591.1 hypothetical protein ASD02_21690 [Ensifer sp. Root1252]KRC54355.1 hypothetical protein ASE32_22870 [Ensifer sp. Root231]KRD01690.1 hypothetical protein ASE47_22245 [Ensifer sp. Root258]MBD9491328.1 hypothetical protein [Ensifer sp. ENS11]
MTTFWPWLSLAGLGAFHGLNPAMGWLFAVALGLHRQSRRTVWLSLVPIAIGHAISIATVLVVVIAFGAALDLDSFRLAAASLILGLAAYGAVYGHRQRVRVGMRTGMAGLAFWSFLMATSHGAGLMLVPAMLSICLADRSGDLAMPMASSLPVALAALAVHSGVMLAVIAAVALAVFEWLGLAALRSAWINFDRLWTLALGATGIALLVQ